MLTTDQLILELIRPRSSSCPQENIDDINFSDEEWQIFLDKVFKDGLSGLVFDHLNHLPSRSFLPEWVYQKCELEYMTNLGRNLIIQEHVKEISHHLHAGEISALIMRGAVFFTRLYSTVGIRPLIDIDIVIHKKDFDRVQELFKELGYHFPEGYPFFLIKDYIYVDLHIDSIGLWRIPSWPTPFNIADKRIWEKTVSVNHSPLVRTLGVYDAILSCCDHLQGHSFERLIWFVDVAQLIKKEGTSFQWETLTARARQFHLQKPVYFVVKYLNTTGFISVPSERLDELGDFSMNRFEKKTLRLLLSNQRAHLSGELLYLFALPSWKQKLRLVWDVVFVEKDHFPLACKKLTVWSYLRRFFKILMYVFAKAFTILRPLRF